MYDFSINGTIDTGQSCLSNLQKLCAAAGSWITYDIAAGKWSFTIKKAGSSKFNFTDDNIIGNISVSSTGITDLYNKVTVSYPHKDLQDKTDQIDMEIPYDKRYQDEIDNTLQINTDLINDPIQAQFMATVELKQNRLDTVIKFTSDYTAIGLKAGDIISITNDIYGFTNKKFRIISIQEDDTDVIQVLISAMEYSDDVYSTDGLIYTKRDTKTGIIPKSANSVLATQDNAAIASSTLNGIDSDPLLSMRLNESLAKSGNAQIFAASSGAIYNNTGPMTIDDSPANMQFIREDTFKPKITGLNIFKISWNFEGGVCNGSRGPAFNEQTDIIKAGVTLRDLETGEVIGSIISGGIGAQSWIDLATDISMDLVKDHNYSISFYYSYYSPEKKAINEAAIPPLATGTSVYFTYFGFGYIPVSTDGTGENVPSITKMIDPDYAAIKVSWPAPGKDFDFKAFIVSPPVQQFTPVGINGDGVGYTAYPETGTPYIVWGGDDANESPGSESIVVNINKLKQDYPNTTKFTIELRGIWGTTTTAPYWHPVSPLLIEGIIWKGGEVILENHIYTNPTAEYSEYLQTLGYANAHYAFQYNPLVPYGTDHGVLMGYFVVDTETAYLYFTSTKP